MQKEKITISIDAMGGANAPHSVIEAIAEICKQSKNISFLIYGDEMQITPLLKNYNISQSRYHFIATEKTISDNDRPVEALRNSANTSMRQAIEAVQNHSANAFMSCGNTGAIMVIAKMALGCIKDIKRPAIIGRMPTIDGHCVMLDLGANVDCTKTHLFQFALMGNCFAKIVFNLSNPTIGILNVGSEEIKGRTLERETAEMLREESSLNFVGHVEGDDIFTGKINVVVTDGFVGNIALKTAEGTVRLFLQLLKNAIASSIFSKIGALFVKKSFKKSLSSIEPSNYNGAMLIGLNGIVVKSHGNSKTPDIKNAIIVAAELARHDINSKIQEELRNIKTHHQIHSGIEKIVDKISEYLHH